jgi:hypothetical protein
LRINRLPSDKLFLFALGVWVAALGSGFTILVRYASAPGAMDTAPRLAWPADSRLARRPHRPTLVMFAHPHCPCSRASVSELARLLQRVPDGLEAYVLFVRPRETSPDWDRTDLWRSAAAIPGVTVLGDEDGVEAARFHALTSGLTVVYDGEGRLLFRGGITSARGHEGNSFGRERIISLLTTGKADRNDSPVFGCALGPAHRASAKGLEDES